MSGAGSTSSSDQLPERKGFIVSLKRLLMRRGAVDSAVQLRPSSTFGPSASGSLELLNGGQTNALLQGTRACESLASFQSCIAPPRSSVSTPALFPAVAGSSSSSFLPSFVAAPIQSGAGRRVLPANSSSTMLLQLPVIEPFAPSLSSGAMSDRVAHATASSPQQLHQQQQQQQALSPPNSGRGPAAAESRFRTLAVATGPLHNHPTSALPGKTSTTTVDSIPMVSERSSESVSLPLISRVGTRGSIGTVGTTAAPCPVVAAAAASIAAEQVGVSTAVTHVASDSAKAAAAAAVAAAVFTAATSSRTAPCTPVGAPSTRTQPASTALSVPMTAAAPAAAPSTAMAATAETAAAAAPAAESKAAGSGRERQHGFPPSSMLAVCSAAPEAMRRPVWRLTDYVITGRLYRGEISSVYKAACRLSGLKVVLKVYSLSRVADNALHTLVREVRIHTELAHPAVLTMYGAFEEESRLVLVLERAARGDLFSLHRNLPRCRMSEDQLRVLVLAPLLDALVYLHGAGVCHRDIKPENLLMTAGWQLLLADFGAAINLTHERAVTRTGTMDYMAPEVERCPLKLLPEDNKDNPQLSYTTAADVWSVGVLAYEMLVGFPPFINCDEGGGLGDSPGDGLGGGGGRRELCFPHFVSAGGQDFISLALSERPGDRPTAAQLLRHPWLKHAVRQYLVRQQQQQQQQGQKQQGQQQQQSLQSWALSAPLPQLSQMITSPPPPTTTTMTTTQQQPPLQPQQSALQQYFALQRSQPQPGAPLTTMSSRLRTTEHHLPLPCGSGDPFLPGSAPRASNFYMTFTMAAAAGGNAPSPQPR